MFKSCLLLEDEPHLRSTLIIALERLGMAVRSCTTIQEAEDYLAHESPDLVLLDRGLPDGDGLSLCQRLRAQLFSGAILVLTASGQTDARIQGLNAGADDYLPKPFSWEELEARVRALARRMKSAVPIPTSPPLLWSVDAAKHRVLGPKGWVDLTALELKLVTQLIQSAGDTLSRETLLKKVWGFTLIPKTRTVDLFMTRLRKVFEEDPENPRHFLTMRGAGYRFER